MENRILLLGTEVGAGTATLRHTGFGVGAGAVQNAPTIGI